MDQEICLHKIFLTNKIRYSPFLSKNWPELLKASIILDFEFMIINFFFKSLYTNLGMI